TFDAVASNVETFMTQQPGGTFATVQEGDWNDGATWGGSVPPDGAVVTVDHAVTMDLPTFALQSLTVNADVTVSGWDSAITAVNVTIASGTVTHLPQTATEAVEGAWIPDARVWFVCDTFTLEDGATIDVTEKGYGLGCGPGAITAGLGTQSAGHGGRSGNSGNTAESRYGDPPAPTEPGSGGGNSYSASIGRSNGGGAVRIEATGAVTIDGAIVAGGGNGYVSWSGKGSGGSVYVSCHTIAGSGSIRAPGGEYNGEEHNGGGGGRIALVYEASTPGTTLYLSAKGGWNRDYGNESRVGLGEPGTVFVSDLSFFPRNNEVITEGFNLYLPEECPRWEPATLDIRDTWVLSDHEPAMTVGNLRVEGRLGRFSFTGESLHCASMTLTNDAVVTVYAVPTNGIDSAAYGTQVKVTGTLSLCDGDKYGVLLAVVADPTNGAPVKIAAGNVAIAANAVIDAAGRGFMGGYIENEYGYGPGAPIDASRPGVGASHGGLGGAEPSRIDWLGPTYGDEEAPTYAGSGAPKSHNNVRSANGGGVVWMDIDKTFLFNGTITANGAMAGVDTWSAGASGGSVYIRCKTLTGEGGTVSANGGAVGDQNRQGGGGGRIAIWRQRDSYVYAGEPLPEGYSFPADASGSFRSDRMDLIGEDGTVVWGWLTEPGTAIIVR
ncbi:MAG: hypothetical protein FWF84_05760, partial [Kiritimatiellaeota bacterium]|nr:hypothetical protein [Kiritimatiellota bacterium]